MTSHSFAVMAYQDSPYLPHCLESLKSQTTPSFIYITTSTPSDYIHDIARQFGVPVFITETGRGIAHDWNFSLQQATTKYVTLAHQDDIYLPEYTARCLSRAEKFQDTLICFTDYTEIVDGVERAGTLLLRVKLLMLGFFMPLKKNLWRPFWKKRLLSVGCPIAAPSVMYNVEKLRDFQFSADYSINMDWDAWCRMAFMPGRFVYANQVLLQHRIHADSATTKGLEANLRQQEDLEIFQRFWPPFLARAIAGFYAGSYKSNQPDAAAKAAGTGPYRLL